MASLGAWKGKVGYLKAELASPLVLGAVLPPFKGPREILWLCMLEILKLALICFSLLLEDELRNPYA